MDIFDLYRRYELLDFVKKHPFDFNAKQLKKADDVGREYFGNDTWENAIRYNFFRQSDIDNVKIDVKRDEQLISKIFTNNMNLFPDTKTAKEALDYLLSKTDEISADTELLLYEAIPYYETVLESNLLYDLVIKSLQYIIKKRGMFEKRPASYALGLGEATRIATEEAYMNFRADRKIFHDVVTRLMDILKRRVAPLTNAEKMELRDIYARAQNELLRTSIITEKTLPFVPSLFSNIGGRIGTSDALWQVYAAFFSGEMSASEWDRIKATGVDNYFEDAISPLTRARLMQADFKQPVDKRKYGFSEKQLHELQMAKVLIYNLREFLSTIRNGAFAVYVDQVFDVNDLKRRYLMVLKRARTYKEPEFSWLDVLADIAEFVRDIFVSSCVECNAPATHICKECNATVCRTHK